MITIILVLTIVNTIMIWTMSGGIHSRFNKIEDEIEGLKNKEDDEWNGDIGNYN